MFVGPSSKLPMELTISLYDRQLIDARMSCIHQTLFVELPILIAVSAEPVSRVIVVFVCEPHCDSIAMECPQLFDEPVVQLSRPLSREKCDNLLSPVRKFGAVPPSRIDSVGKRDLLGVTRIPTVFSEANLLNGRLFREGRQ